jgi:hypothetical protein
MVDAARRPAGGRGASIAAGGDKSVTICRADDERTGRTAPPKIMRP